MLVKLTPADTSGQRRCPGDQCNKTFSIITYVWAK
jgi:hypothetical protein